LPAVSVTVKTGRLSMTVVPSPSVTEVVVVLLTLADP
jgi:hypothetical protein